ncbi:prolactin receptor a [Alosa sapidissima]|uniref:prolactin receptor a n=1 Tax=Alosa sapidissima TaxID=34773 RepID=UPI001C0945FC|nr:prolactin receptor a [Alosa sapidissima]XP_041915006.1 prolactin receptor a [Alosa sapidissima]
MRRNIATDLILSILFSVVTNTVCITPPGKPKITSCRSPEKETFTCWWEPGYDGGLPTTYALYYRLETSETVYECPDYHTAGPNSCYFNKNDTSIWVNYNITVVATNRRGTNYSDPVDVDVVYIVQPHTPENVTVLVKADEQGPYLRVSWEKPRNADTSSGWITLVYQLRVKLKNQDEWEEHDVGQQKTFNVFSPHSGGTYMVQVRCKPDHGLWSEWSTTSYIQVPDYITRERSMWIIIAIFTVLVFIILTWILNLKRSSVKHCLLPPVPGPKIIGIDRNLLKNGKSEDVFNALVIPGFPPSDYEDLLVEYLEVYDSENQELMLDGKDLQEGCLKLKSPSDNDSGRGSCDSHTLLMEKVAKEEPTLESSQQEVEAETPSTASPQPEYAQPSAWPTVLAPDQPYQLDSPWKSLPDVFISPPVSPQLKCTTGPKHKKGLYEPSINGLEGKGDSMVSSPRTMEYVEVQRVNQQNVLLLRPLAEQNLGSHTTSVEMPEEDYSKVKGVTSNNVLLLQQEVSTQYISDQEETCPMMQQTQLGKPVVHHPPAVVPGGMQLTSNGYVDTATY